MDKYNKKKHEIFIQIKNGYNFRCLFNMIRNLKNEVTFVFHSEGFFIKFMNKDKNAMIDVEINGVELNPYYYNSKKSKLELTFSSSVFFTNIGSVGKKDTLFICKLFDEEKIRNYTIKNNNNANNQTIIITPILIFQYKEPPSIEKNFSSKFSVKIPSGEFSEFCKKCSQSKSDYLVIAVYKYGVIFTAKDSADEDILIKNYIDRSEIDNEFYYDFSVPVSIIKRLDTIICVTNTTNDNIFIYFTEKSIKSNNEVPNVPIKIAFKCSNYGNCKIYLKKLPNISKIR